MKKYLILMVLFLSGCSTTVPVTVKFPTLPEELSVMCPPLKQIPKEAKLSDIAKTVTDNYQLYHLCSVNNGASKKYNKGDDMLETLFWFALGAFVGWNFPQPQFAKSIQAKVLAMLRKE